MLRPYQQQMLTSIRENYQKGSRQQLVSSATGTGKTVTFANLPTHMRDLLPGQTLVLAHRTELLDQAIDKIRAANPLLKVQKEMASDRADVDSDVIVASVASLGRKGTKRTDRFDWDRIDTIITDEAHHATSQSYLNIYEIADVLRTDTKKLHVGFTATPNRSDGEGLAKVFKKIVFTYGMRQAIEDGYLVDIRGIRVSTDTTLDGIKSKGGDFDQGELADRVNNPERNQRIVKAWLDQAQGLSTVAFTVDIRHAVDLAAMFRHYGVKAEAIWGDDPDRADKLARHRAGEITVLTNCGVLTEGYDDPALSCVILARPTKSGVFFTQAVGRGTRLFAGKTFCLVLDVVDASSRHSLVTLPTLMGMSAKLDLKGQSLVGAVKKLEDAQKEHAHIDFSTLSDISTLSAFIESVNLFEVKFPAEVESNSELSWHPSPTGGYVLLLPDKDKLTIAQDILDNFVISGSIRGKRYRGERATIEEAFTAADTLIQNAVPDLLKVIRREEAWHGEPATPAQLKLLAKLARGKSIPLDITKGRASKMISSFMAAKG